MLNLENFCIDNKGKKQNFSMKYQDILAHSVLENGRFQFANYTRDSFEQFTLMNEKQKNEFLFFLKSTKTIQILCFLFESFQ